MTEERRQSGERRRPAAVSVRRLEGKIDELKAGQRSLSERVDAYKLNGKAPALVLLADCAPDLLKLAQAADQLVGLAVVAPDIIAAVQRDSDVAAFWRVTRRILNPLRPAGALAWTVIGTIAAALIWNLFVHV